MRTLRFLALLTLASFFCFTSCQKEALEETQEQLQSTEFISGEVLATTAGTNSAEIQAIRNEQIASFKKEAKTGTLQFEETTGRASSRSRSITDISCGTSINGTTRGETNTVSKYEGSDKVYLLNLDGKKDVSIQLSQLQSDLDLFVTEVLVDGFGRKFIGDYLTSGTKGGTSSEDIDLELSKGEYFIIVETYEFESNFKLSVSCKGDTQNPVPGPDPVHCENYQNLVANYDRGISEQSNLWNLWRGDFNDALVLHENSNSSNKVIKIDNSRFGHQDVVRDIIGLPISSGWYTMEFDLFVAGNSGVAEMLTEKTRSYGEEQGFKLKVENNQLKITHRNKVTTAKTRIPSNTWIRVAMSFDMVSNRIIVLINGVRITMRADAQRAKTNQGRRSIQGINFYGDEFRSKFHIDNVCINEIEIGHDDPTKPFCSGPDPCFEEIDLSN